MYTVILIGLFLSLAAPAADGPPPPVPVVLGVLAGILAVFALWGWLNALILGHVARRSPEPSRVLLRHSRTNRFYTFAALAAYAAFLYGLRWGPVTDLLLGPRLAQVWLVSGLAIAAPFLLLLGVIWWGAYRNSLVLRRAVAEQGIRLPAGIEFTFASWFVFYLRQYLLVILIPYVLVLGIHDATRFVASTWFPDIAVAAEEASLYVSLLLLYVFSPFLLQVIWPTRSFPAGPLRDRLLAVADRSRVKVRDVVLWNTRGLMVNACMTGVARQLRLVFLSDSLVDSLSAPQVEAVFGHELGHARYRHIPFFFLVALGSVLILTLFDLLRARYTDLEEWTSWAFLALFVLCYWLGFFGYVSRRFERQSDLVGATTVDCPGHHDPLACPTHRPPAAADPPAGESDAQPPPSASPGIGEPFAGHGPDDPDLICPFRAWAFNSALERIAALNGTPVRGRAWRHFGIGRRTDFINSMIGRPAAVRAYHRRLWIFKILFFLAVAALAAATLTLIHAQ